MNILVTGDLGESQRVYWICPPRDNERHATTCRPGALVQNSTINAVCGDAIKVPVATLYGRVPRSKDIDARCAGCVAATADWDADHVNWDF